MVDDGASLNIDEFGLTIKQRLFAENYVVMLNGTKAARAAGYSEAGIRVTAHRLLANANVKSYIEKLFDAAKMGPKEVIGQLSALSRADIGDYLQVVEVDRDGVKREEWRFDLVKAIKDNNTSLIKSIKRDRYGVVVELFDKVRMLELIGKHNRLFADVTIAGDKPDQTAAEELSDNALARIAAAGDVQPGTPGDVPFEIPYDAPGDATSDDNVQSDDI